MDHSSPRFQHSFGLCFCKVSSLIFFRFPAFFRLPLLLRSSRQNQGHANIIQPCWPNRVFLQDFFSPTRVRQRSLGVVHSVTLCLLFWEVFCHLPAFFPYCKPSLLPLFVSFSPCSFALVTATCWVATVTQGRRLFIVFCTSSITTAFALQVGNV